MKQLHTFSLLVGITLGFLMASGLSYLQQTRAADDKKEVISQEELDKNLDGILESQKGLIEHVETILIQTQFLKAAAGK